MARHPADHRSLRSAPIHRLTAPVRRFLQIEAASGVVLLLCAIVALVLANTSFGPAVHHLWQTPLRIGVGPWELNKPLEFWINDGLMTIFFFVVGLEIKRELMTGELRSVRRATLPVIGAIGGMLVPAGVYLMFGHTGPALRGWGIPMATDIAFVVGVLAAFGSRVPFGLKIFLLSLAIADDMGAVLVIAVFYTEQLNWLMLALAGGGFMVIIVLNALGVRQVLIYTLVGIAIWLAVYQSGIHPTIAGVILGLLTPYRSWLDRNTLRLALEDVSGQLGDRQPDTELAVADLAILRFAAREAVAPLQRLEDRLHPWIGFVAMPVFALANAGVEVKLAAVTDSVSLAVLAGLLIGKPVGIVLFSWIAVKTKLAQLPAGVTWPMMIAGGFLGGIGFTMSLFVGSLAFPEQPELLAAAKTGILFGSGLAALVGAVVLASCLKRSTR
jgi:Na+:H+ antiporter, NhaA family